MTALRTSATRSGGSRRLLGRLGPEGGGVRNVKVMSWWEIPSEPSSASNMTSVAAPPRSRPSYVSITTSPRPSAHLRANVEQGRPEGDPQGRILDVDMKNYLRSMGFSAEGYRLKAEDWRASTGRRSSPRPRRGSSISSSSRGPRRDGSWSAIHARAHRICARGFRQDLERIALMIRRRMAGTPRFNLAERLGAVVERSA